MRKCLNDRLIDWRKGYRHYFKTAYKWTGIFGALAKSVERLFKALKILFVAFGILLFRLIAILTFPLWIFPIAYLDYKDEYQRLKKLYALHGVELTDDYQPRIEDEYI